MKFPVKIISTVKDRPRIFSVKERRQLNVIEEEGIVVRKIVSNYYMEKLFWRH